MPETTLVLIETTIAQKTVRMRLADQADPPKEWIDFQVIPGEYQIENHKLSENPDRMPLGATRLAALRRAQSVIASEIARLSNLVGKSP
jgi:hypothetical protein